MCEQEGDVAVEDITARTEVARRTTADMRRPCTRDRGPVKPLTIPCKEAEAR